MVPAGLGRFMSRLPQTRGSFGVNRPAGRRCARLRGPPPGAGVSLAGNRGGGGGRLAFTLERMGCRAGMPGRDVILTPPAFFQIVFGLPSDFFGSPPPFGGRQLDSGATRFRQANGYGLLRGSRPVFPLAEVVKFLAHKFTGLGGRGFSFTGVFVRPINNCLVSHGSTRRIRASVFNHQKWK